MIAAIPCESTLQLFDIRRWGVNYVGWVHVCGFFGRGWGQEPGVEDRSRGPDLSRGNAGEHLGAGWNFLRCFVLFFSLRLLFHHRKAKVRAKWDTHGVGVISKYQKSHFRCYFFHLGHNKVNTCESFLGN